MAAKTTGKQVRGKSVILSFYTTVPSAWAKAAKRLPARPLARTRLVSPWCTRSHGGRAADLCGLGWAGSMEASDAAEGGHCNASLAAAYAECLTMTGVFFCGHRWCTVVGLRDMKAARSPSPAPVSSPRRT
ncbi:hypothetical protein LX32DRAFT_635390 [Colletotrichum zoysiae]|uniref:Uncharacterized protein n=1 Tax=Colletotrichum zoysiae TaxID=1216348 RepID=A0AAD9HR21_9PEZI|nr:hypothetical protein LX32DRAFT_635390 [Colletotrichum zoysiae]